MCRMSSLDEAKTVIMEIQIDSAGSEFELDDNGHLSSNRLGFIQYCFDELKKFVTNQTYLRIQNHSQHM